MRRLFQEVQDDRGLAVSKKKLLFTFLTGYVAAECSSARRTKNRLCNYSHMTMSYYFFTMCIDENKITRRQGQEQTWIHASAPLPLHDRESRSKQKVDTLDPA